MNIIKRIFSIFVVAMLALFAFSYGTTKTVKAEGNVCKIVRTGTEYTTVGYAINAAQNGDTIQLIANYSRNSSLGITKNITIDFNDYVLSFGSSGHFEFSTGYEDVTLTLRTSGTGGIENASGKMFQFNYDTLASYNNIITIESGSYTSFQVYSYSSNKWLSADESGIPEHFVINGGTFTFGSDAIRNNFRGSIASGSLISSTDSPTRTLVVKPASYVTSENTNASAKITYTDGYSYYQKVTSLSSSDAGKKYLIGYSNLSEKSILLITGEKYGGWSYIITDRHVYIPNNPTDTWRVENDSKFYGDVNNSYFYTLSYSGGKYQFTNSAGNYLTHTTGTSLTIKTPEEVALAASSENPYRVDFTFTPSSSYLSTGTGGSTAYITYYTTQRDSKYVFEMYGSASYSGLGENNKHLFAHLYEKVDVDPEVSTAAIRFGKTMTKDMYDLLSGCGTTVTFGVIAKKTADLGGAELTVSNASMNRTITPVRVNAAGDTEEDLEGNFYQFALVLGGITSSNFETSITARCYVCIDGDYYYFNPSEYSLKTLAAAYYNAVDTSSYTEHLPVLGYLKDYGG